MVLFAKNRRYYLIPLEHKEKPKKFLRKQKSEKFGEIFDKRKNLIGKIKVQNQDIIVTETNGVVCLRLIKIGGSSFYTIENHFKNYLGRIKISTKSHKKIIIEDENYEKILFTRGFVEWHFTIQNKQKKKIAVGTTTDMMFSKDTFGIRHTKPSFLLSMKPHHPDSRFLLAIFIILLRKLSRTDISKYYLKLRPALPL